MKIVNLGLVVGLALFVSTQGVAQEGGLMAFDSAYFTVSDVEVSEVPATLDALEVGDFAPPSDPGVSTEPDSFDVVLDKIVNLGKKIWEVVNANKPVVNVKTDTANALPDGVKAWHNLQGWQTPKAKVYRVVYKNLYGMSVVDFSFRVIFTYGGNVHGKGRYLGQVTVIPADLSVAWGYTFNAQGSVPHVFNTGSHEDPLGAMELRMKWSVDTWLKHQEKTMTFFLRGDGVFDNLTNGNFEY